jgi:hypothetical protein
MAYKKFFPTSNDPFLLADADMALAKFGHLNSLIDYVNQIGFGTANTATAAVSLLPSQSGNTFFLAKADGITYTLPTTNQVTIGTTYKFVVSVDVTSNNYIIQTASSSDLFKGFALATLATGAITTYSANGSSHRIFTMNGGTKGGLVGSEITVVCTGVNEWYVTAKTMATTTLATPFS